MHFLDRIFTGKTLLALNAALIAVSLLWGGGTAFHDTGLVHIVAILFIGLAVSRMFQDYKLYDPFIRKFVLAALIALLFFAASHFVEFLGLVVFHLPKEAALVNVYAVYIASVLFFTLGVQFVLRKTGKQSSLYSWGLIAALTLLITAIIYVMVRPTAHFESVSTPGAAMGLFGASLMIITLFQIVGFAKIRAIIPALGKMQDWLIMTSLFIIVSMVPDTAYQLYDAQLERMGIDAIKTTYLSHYGFYAAASTLFLSFSALGTMGGIYKDMRAAE